MSAAEQRSPGERTRLCHERIPFSGQRAFLDTARGLLHAAVGAGQACLLLAEPDSISTVRSDFAAQADADVTYLDMSMQGRNPARVLPALTSFVAAHPDRQLCIVSEPMPVGQQAAVRAEAEFAEWILQLAPCRDWPASVWCLYDQDELDPAAIAALEAAHREGAGVADAERELAARFGDPLPAPPRDARPSAADLTTLGALRRTVGSFAAAAGLPEDRSADLVYAVNEVVTNSICHGEGRARVLLWAEADAAWCQVEDRGRISDPLVGRAAPRTGQLSGRGLWLVNQLCDLVQVRSPETGTTVRLSIEF